MRRTRMIVVVLASDTGATDGMEKIDKDRRKEKEKGDV